MHLDLDLKENHYDSNIIDTKDKTLKPDHVIAMEMA